MVSVEAFVPIYFHTLLLGTEKSRLTRLLPIIVFSLGPERALYIRNVSFNEFLIT